LETDPIDDTWPDIDAWPEDAPWNLLLGFWRSCILPGDTAPTDLGPIMQLPEIADGVIIVDTTGPVYRYEHIGQAVSLRLGQDLTGQALGGSQLADSVKEGFARLLDSVSRLRKPRLLQIASARGKQNYILALPVLNATGATRQIVIGVYPDYREYPELVIRDWRKIDLD